MEILELIMGIFELISGIFQFIYFLLSGGFKLFIAGPFLLIGTITVWMIQGRKKLLWDMLQDYENALWGLLIVAGIVGIILLVVQTF